MTTLALDTHALIKRLTQAGFAEAQAEALTEAFKDTQTAYLEDLATRSDVNELRSGANELRSEVNELQSELKRYELTFIKNDLKELELGIENKFESMRGEQKLLKWMISFTLAGVVAVILLLLRMMLA